MKLSAIEPLRSKDINDNVIDRLDINLKRSIDSNLKRANLLLAETITAPPKILEFESVSAEHCQLEDIQTSRQPVEFMILIIENDDFSRISLSKMLHGKDIQVIEAKESRVGIDLAKRLLPDLVICELMMPEIDGYGVKYFLQHFRITEKIPLLFITTHTEQTDLDSETILLANNNKIEPVTREKLCDAIADKLVSPTQV